MHRKAGKPRAAPRVYMEDLRAGAARGMAALRPIGARYAQRNHLIPAVTILLVRGPEPQPSPFNHILPEIVRSRLAERAAAAGERFAVRACGTPADMLACLADLDADTRFLLFDPGYGATASPELCSMLGRLRVPFIEVHDDTSDQPERPLDAPSAPRHQLVQGYGAQGYALGLAIALEHLGCERALLDCHVGT